jgi:uncharacterized protein
MTAQSLDTKVRDFLAQKRIAVAGVSRDTGGHPAANLIYRRLKQTGREVIPVNPHMQTFDGERCYADLRSIPGGVDGVIVHDCVDARVSRVWMHQSLAKSGSSVSPAAVEYCQEHGITVIAGACPMMYGDGVDFGHACMRWMLKLTGGLPS